MLDIRITSAARAGDRLAQDDKVERLGISAA
jgi:hypothetical protein